MTGTSIPSASSSERESNLERLLHSFTPHVPLMPISENFVENLNGGCNPLGKPIREFFLLRDLWSSFEECSAYGQGTEVTLKDGNNATQYFTPYLSAIHVFTNKRILKKDVVGSGSDKTLFPVVSDTSNELVRSSSDKSTESKLRDSGDSSTERSYSQHSDDGLNSNPYIEFCASGNPHNRAPFFTQINELARKNPELLTLKSTDLAPSSWMAIAWYPIYRIPGNGVPVEDLGAAFITFHTLSSFYPADKNGTGGLNDKCCSQVMVDGKNKSKEKSHQTMPLTPFGMAALNLTGEVWFNNGESDKKMYDELNKAVIVWLKQRCFFHHDFNFFSLKARHRAQ